MLDNNVILRQSHALTKRSKLSDGIFVQQNNMIHTLNETALEIFDMFDGTRSIDDIVNGFGERYPEIDSIREISEDFIRQLIEAGLLIE